MDLKIFKMNDFDTVISHLSKEDTNEWYKKEFGLDSDEQSINEVEELELTNGFWSECSGIVEIADIIEETKEGKEIKFKKMSNCIFIWTTFQELIELNKSNYNEPFVVCSTEW
jgi:hypothetical protein